MCVHGGGGGGALAPSAPPLDPPLDIAVYNSPLLAARSFLVSKPLFFCVGGPLLLWNSTLKAVSNIIMKDLSVDKLSVPNVSVVQKDVLLHIFSGSGANYQGTRKVIFNQWPRPWCSYASDGHI